MGVATNRPRASLRVLVAYSVAALLTAIVAGMGASSLLTLRTRGLLPRAPLPLGAVLGAGCGLFIVGVFGGVGLQNPYSVAGALNGAMWGFLVAYYVLKVPCRVPARPAR